MIQAKRLNGAAVEAGPVSGKEARRGPRAVQALQHVAGNATTSEAELCLWRRALLRSKWQDGGMGWQGAAFHRHACCVLSCAVRTRPACWDDQRRE